MSRFAIECPRAGERRVGGARDDTWIALVSPPQREQVKKVICACRRQRRNGRSRERGRRAVPPESSPNANRDQKQRADRRQSFNCILARVGHYGDAARIVGRGRFRRHARTSLRFDRALYHCCRHEDLPTESGGIPGVARPRRAHGAHEAHFHRAGALANPHPSGRVWGTARQTSERVPIERAKFRAAHHAVRPGECMCREWQKRARKTSTTRFV